MPNWDGTTKGVKGGFETAEQAAERGKFDLTLVAVLSDTGLRRSEAASLTWAGLPTNQGRHAATGAPGGACVACPWSSERGTSW